MPVGTCAGAAIPGPTLLVHGAVCGVTDASWPAMTWVMPTVLPDEATRYEPGSTSTKPYQPFPSAVIVRTVAPVDVDVSVICAPGVAVPLTCPVVGEVFHGIGGTAAGCPNTPAGCASAATSAPRDAAPLRVPASVAASGVRYEYPAQPAPSVPDVLGATAMRAWVALEAISLRYRPVPITAKRPYW